MLLLMLLDWQQCKVFFFDEWLDEVVVVFNWYNLVQVCVLDEGVVLVWLFGSLDVYCIGVLQVFFECDLCFVVRCEGDIVWVGSC